MKERIEQRRDIVATALIKNEAKIAHKIQKCNLMERNERDGGEREPQHCRSESQAQVGENNLKRRTTKSVLSAVLFAATATYNAYHIYFRKVTHGEKTK